MALLYKEAGFPADYREAEVRRILNAVTMLRSIGITGLAGMGKSNVVRFIVSHPQVGMRYLKERAKDYTFIHLDCAALPSADEADILNEMMLELQRNGISAGAAETPGVSRSIRHMVKQNILGAPPDLNLVLVFDYFDEAAAKLNRAFYNFLFHLRNTRPRGNLSYIFVTRRPLGHLHELQELLDDGCAIGPLKAKDALDSIRRDEARLGCTFDAAQREKLVACTGGHPGFLKNASELLYSGEVDTTLSEEDMAGQLLRSAKVKNLCEELWSDLTEAEQDVLLCVAREGALPQPVDGPRVAYLEQTGVLVTRANRPDGSEAGLFCPLFEGFVREKKSALSGRILITARFPNQAHIKTPKGEEWIKLSPRLTALLLALSEAAGQVVTIDQLISQVYGDEAAGVTNAALSQLVKRLREVIDPRAQKLMDDPMYTCVETIHSVGYRLVTGIRDQEAGN
jgi:DNA-binding winged helix-turn-helix (wHTH) protein